MAFFIDFFGFCIDLGSILTRFWKDFSKIFRIFLKSADLQNSCAHAVFRKGRVLKNIIKTVKKIGTKSMLFFNVKKNPKIMKKNGFGGVCGSI